VEPRICSLSGCENPVPAGCRVTQKWCSNVCSKRGKRARERLANGAPKRWARQDWTWPETSTVPPPAKVETQLAKDLSDEKIDRYKLREFVYVLAASARVCSAHGCSRKIKKNEPCVRRSLPAFTYCLACAQRRKIEFDRQVQRKVLSSLYGRSSKRDPKSYAKKANRNSW
jgi:hypothetical protein